MSILSSFSPYELIPVGQPSRGERLKAKGIQRFKATKNKAS